MRNGFLHIQNSHDAFVALITAMCFALIVSYGALKLTGKLLSISVQKGSSAEVALKGGSDEGHNHFHSHGVYSHSHNHDGTHHHNSH